MATLLVIAIVCFLVLIYISMEILSCATDIVIYLDRIANQIRISDQIKISLNKEISK